MLRLIFALLIVLSMSQATLAQDATDCNPRDVAGMYIIVLDQVDTMEELENAATQLNRSLAICRNSESEIGLTRTNPVSAGVNTQVTDTFAVSILAHADVSDTLSGDDVKDDMVYMAVGFDYQCTLSPDELCEGNLGIVSAVGQSGNVYDYFPVNADGIEWNWELYGGGTKRLYVIFELDPADAENFLLRFTDRDSNRNEQTRFFLPGELR